MTNSASIYPLTIHKVTYGPAVIQHGRQRLTTRNVMVYVDEGWGGSGVFLYKKGRVEFGRSRVVELQPEKPWWRFW